MSYPDRARARERRLVVRVACGGCDVVVRAVRAQTGGNAEKDACAVFLLFISVRYYTRARDGLGGRGIPWRAHRAVGEDPTSGTSTHYFTRAPLLLVAQRRGLPYLTYADRRAKLARPNLSLTWFSTGCEALAAVATFRVNMRSSVSRRATS